MLLNLHTVQEKQGGKRGNGEVSGGKRKWKMEQRENMIRRKVSSITRRRIWARETEI